MKHFLSFIAIFLFSIALSTTLAQTKVVSYNVRYANNHDGDFSWNNRKGKIATKLSKDNHSIICMQEVLKEQLDFFNETLNGYKSVGVGRDDGKSGGEFCPIYYKVDDFKLLEWGTKWLSETPDSVSISWNAACYRIATWAVLENNKGQKFIVINTHFDHISQLARDNSSDIINNLATILEQKYKTKKVVLCGDFNATVEDNSIIKLLANFTNSRPNKTTQPNYSFIGFNEDDSVRCLIDFIFVKGLKTKDYIVDEQNYGLGQLSDHLSISVIVE